MNELWPYFLYSGSRIMCMNLWNDMGELFRLKNMTFGSNSPLHVLKAAFHSSPEWIQMLL